MASINDLEERLKKLDATASRDTRLEGIAFEKTYNDKLGLPTLQGKDLSPDFLVFIPWRTWTAWPNRESKSPDTSYPSAVQAAFKDVLRAGSDPAKCFIDIITLNPHAEFFNEGQAESVANAIAEIVNKTDESVQTEIRLLAGTEDNLDADTIWAQNQAKFEEIFWRNGQPLIDKNKKAKLYVGYYSPSFKIGASPEIVSWGNSLKDLVSLISGILHAAGWVIKSSEAIAKILDTFNKEYLDAFLTKGVLPSISWNHAKILAVNGKTVMTGGANYWREYLGTAHDIIDHQVKLTGDAAISAHKYADYFWKYLQDIPKTDDHSFQQSTSLSSEGKPVWSTSEKAPAENPFRLISTNDPNAIKDKTPVLTTSKLGDWHGAMTGLSYPVQFVDAVRDLFLNILWQTNAGLPERELGIFMVNVADAFNDDTGYLTKSIIFPQLSVNPAAWATRIARNHAISKAKHTVHIGQQMLVDSLQLSSGSYRDLVKTTNSDLLAGKDAQKWNGYMWPIDLLVAIAQALLNMKLLKKEDGGGVFLALTTHHAGGTRQGWEDPTPITKIKDRVRVLLKGMPQRISDADAKALVDEKFQVKRVLKDDGTDYLHAKVVCVDRKLMYVGSDNAYPNYNEEHGIWIEHTESINQWFSGFWDELWDRSLKADAEDFEMRGPPE